MGGSVGGALGKVMNVFHTKRPHQQPNTTVTNNISTALMSKAGEGTGATKEEDKLTTIDKKKLGSSGLQVPLTSQAATTTPASSGVQI